VNKARPELPVFLITGRHEFADQDQAPGASRRFFRKPFDAKALLAAVRDALRDNGNGG
jgi:DNA-binding response OmpR family regulator